MLRFVGIDIARRTHLVAMVDEHLNVLLKPFPITEDAAGYERLFALLGSPADTLVVMEATGHYWRNLFAALCNRGFRCAVVNPLRTRRFAEEELRRAKTDRIDALAMAHFGAQKRPEPTPAPDADIDNLRELVYLHNRLQQDLGNRLRQIHRLVALVFPEFTQVVRTLDSRLALALLRHCPTAKAFRHAGRRQIARLRYCGQRNVGATRAAALVALAHKSVAQHHGPAHEASMRLLCADVVALQQSLEKLLAQIHASVAAQPLACLLNTIDGLGPLTVARLISRLGDPSRFRSPAALAAYVGVVPGTNQSGLRRSRQAPLSPLGSADLRAWLWMPTLVAVKRNPWLRAHYQRLVARGKPPKLALVAAMRKLLGAVYSVAKNRRPFVPLMETD